MDLKLAVLSRGPRLYSTRRLVQEAKKRGIDVEVTDADIKETVEQDWQG